MKYLKIGDTVAINCGVGRIADIAVIGCDEFLIVTVSGGHFYRHRDEVRSARKVAA